jgi:SWI/SNF-related matrix-associated actin-dependent regulator 1 of chromatin subfamily A
MDSDGSCCEGVCEFKNISEHLAQGVLTLARSLGGTGRIKKKFCESYTQGFVYVVRISLPTLCPFRVLSKSKTWKPSRLRSDRRAIVGIEYAGEYEQKCISVSHPSNLYITDDYLPTHNTTQAISFANELFEAGELEDVLILCEASQKAHWNRQWPDWTTTDLDIGVIQRKPRQKNGVKRTVSIIPDTAAVVVNYDILGKVHDWLTEQEWSLVIADECQALRNMEAERTRLVFGDVERSVTLPNGRGGFFRKRLEAVAPIRAARRIFLTGTPIENRVHDLWPIVRAFDPDGLGSDYEYFIKRYCGAFWTDYGWNTSGSSNLIELQRYLRSTFMVRRTTAQALPDMPPKSRRPIFIPADNFKSILKKEDDVLGRNLDALEQHLAMERSGDETVEERMFSVWEELHNKFGAEVEDWSYEDIMEHVPEEASVAFHEIAKFRSELALAKVPFIIDHVRQITDAGQKVVVFFYHTAVGQALKAAWGDSCGYIDGSVKAEKRQEEVDRFQEDEDCVAIFGQLHAASKGFTMTVANRAVFGELDWRPGTMKQAENRIWRISQENHCLIDHMIIESSIEVRQSQSLIEKQAAMDAALDEEFELEYSD